MFPTRSPRGSAPTPRALPRTSFAPVLELLEARTVPSFLPAVHYDLGPFTSPNHIASGDFNGDGTLDLVTANGLNRSFSVLLGNRGGTFQSARNEFALWAPYFVVAGHLDGDGRLDLVTTNLAGDVERAITVWRGRGDGTFQEDRDYAAARTPSGLVAGDFNNDGRLDVAVMGALELSVLVGNGDGTFQAARNLYAGRTTFGVAVGDFNNDGNQDLATANWFDDSVSVLLGNGDGSFQNPVAYAAVRYAWGVVVGDFNGDRHQDLAVPNLRSADLSVFLGNGDGTFRPRVDYRVGPDGSNPQSVSIGDFNGDGRQDLVVNNSLLGVSVLLGTGDGSFQGPLHYAAGMNPRHVAVEDFNGDGFVDLAVTNFESHSVSVLLNDADWGQPALIIRLLAPGLEWPAMLNPAEAASQRAADVGWFLAAPPLLQDDLHALWFPMPQETPDQSVAPSPAWGELDWTWTEETSVTL